MIARSLLTAAVVSAALLLPGAASAQETAQVEQTWYGWQNMLATYSSIGMIGVGAATEEGWLIPVGIGVYALGGPVVHLAHENYASAGISLGLNLGLPLGGALLGLVAGCGIGKCDGFSEGLAAALGISLLGLGGIVTAHVIDVAVLAYDERPVPSGTAASALGARPAWIVPPLQFGGRF